MLNAFNEQQICKSYVVLLRSNKQYRTVSQSRFGLLTV